MQCPDCGAYAGEEDLFCGECGRPFAKERPSEGPLSPEEAKDLPTVAVNRPAPPPALPAAAPVPAGKKRSLLPILLFVAAGFLVLCLLVGGLIFWVGSRAITSATGTPPEPVVRTLLYEDDFSDPDSGWDRFEEEDTWAGYVDGEYRIGVYQADYMAWGNPDPEQVLTDFRIEVDARYVEGPLDNNFGVLVRYQPDSEDFYWFQISSDGYYSVDLRQAGEWTTLVGWEATDAIRQDRDATNRLSVVCRGSQLDFYVNDVLVSELNDDTLTAGSIGLAAGAFEEPNVVIGFDNLTVYGLQD